MCILNLEIRSIYRNQIRSWFDRIVKDADRADLYRAVLQKDTEKLAGSLTALLKRSISTFDSEESFYHGCLLSILTGMKDYASAKELHRRIIRRLNPHKNKKEPV